MSETLIPTARLRFIEKPEPVDGTGMVSTTRKIRVLQQQFYQPSGRVVWIDVPLETPEVADREERITTSRSAGRAARATTNNRGAMRWESRR